MVKWGIPNDMILLIGPFKSEIFFDFGHDPALGMQFTKSLT